jgi:hypothetical protein
MWSIKSFEKKSFRWSFVLLLLWNPIFSGELKAQSSRLTLQAEREKSARETQMKINGEADSLLHYSFPPIEIEGEYHFKNKGQEKKYHQLYDDIKRTYPLSKIVASEVKLVNTELDSIYKTKAQRKEYLKWYEKHVYHTYIDTLISLNNRQTKLFIKLIKRETGNTPYELIKKYRGGFDAFFWQVSANAMLLNLKSDYDPSEDAMIEDIIIKFY